MKEFLTPKAVISRRAYIALGSIAFLLTLAVWSVLSYKGVVKPYFLPTPTAVLEAIVDLFREQGFAEDIKVSFYRVMMGFAISAALAVPLGVLMGTFKFVEALIEPFNDFIRYLPVPAFIPLAILWIGLGSGCQISIIFIGTFFQLVIMVMDVVAQVPKEYMDLSSTYGARSWQMIRDVILPASLPGIFDCLRVAVGWAWSYLVLAEIVAANKGVGHMIMEAQRYLRTDNVFAGIIVIGLLGLTIDFVFKLLYRPLFGWTEKGVT